MQDLQDWRKRALEIRASPLGYRWRAIEAAVVRGDSEEVLRGRTEREELLPLLAARCVDLPLGHPYAVAVLPPATTPSPSPEPRRPQPELLIINI